MSKTLLEMVSEYEQYDRQVEAIDAKLEEIKQKKRALAESIRSTFGNGPHNVNGKDLVIAVARGGTPFLRAPLKPPTRKAKETNGTTAAATSAVDELPSE